MRAQLEQTIAGSGEARGRRVDKVQSEIDYYAARLVDTERQALTAVTDTARSSYGELASLYRARLEELLLKGPEKLGYETPLWTCARVAHLIEHEFGIEYHRGHVWKVLDDLGWSCQRPVGRARERNEEEIRRWKRVHWPGIKKKPGPKGARSSSSTKAG